MGSCYFSNDLTYQALKLNAVSKLDEIHYEIQETSLFYVGTFDTWYIIV